MISQIIQSQIDELTRALEHELEQAAFVQAILGVEFLGAMSDDKPLRADKQSTKRFRIGLRKYFPKRYGAPAIVDLLYKQLRCNLSHLSMPSNGVVFDLPSNHLLLTDQGIVVNKVLFIQDYLSALEKLLTKIESGELILKKGLPN
ncbi:hypothetical protein OAH12_00275 [Cyclobacteriaceae bacterium]|nr:hypothetical protein [Cyclobacteriaceae bacterium]